jgi:hypothetical protein
MAIDATINVAGDFVDIAQADYITTLKRCHLGSDDSLTGGKAIVVSGITDDSGGVTIDPSDTGFLNAAGEEVSLTDVDRILVTGNPGVSARFGTNAVILKAVGGRVAVTCCVGAGDKNVKIKSLSGTSAYTLLMWQAD